MLPPKSTKLFMSLSCQEGKVGGQGEGLAKLGFLHFYQCLEGENVVHLPQLFI